MSAPTWEPCPGCDFCLVAVARTEGYYEGRKFALRHLRDAKREALNAARAEIAAMVTPCTGECCRIGNGVLVAAIARIDALRDSK